MSIQQYAGAPGPSSLQPPSSTTTVPPNPSLYALQYPHPSREAELDAVQALRHTSARSIEGHYHPPGAISLMQQYQANQQAYQWSPGRAQSLALPAHDAPHAHRAKRGREEDDGDVARYPHEEHDATADFTQTFYDPFRFVIFCACLSCSSSLLLVSSIVGGPLRLSSRSSSITSRRIRSRTSRFAKSFRANST